MRGSQSIIANRDKNSNEGNGIVASLCLHLVSFIHLARFPIFKTKHLQLGGENDWNQFVTDAVSACLLYQRPNSPSSKLPPIACTASAVFWQQIDAIEIYGGDSHDLRNIEA